MKYKELIQFEPITSVIELVNANEAGTAENLVKSFVFSKKMREDIFEVIIQNLLQNPPHETKGIQIVGSYGTGKSHLMSVVSSIAENSNLLQFIKNDELKKDFAKIAGKYKVLRFELGSDAPLKDIFFDRIEMYLKKIGVTFAFDRKSTLSWKELIQQMMATFEEKFPNYHFLIVIDEMLEYLKGRNPTELNNDLMLLRQAGEACDNSRFKFMFGVQELLYRSSEFQHAAEMLQKVEDRYSDLIITKDDVSYVVKERLLKKDLHQKEKIREHLLRFSHLFDGINNKLNEFVDLFPVHPDYITYFEKIKHGKHQREILKALSTNFLRMMEEDVPESDPGLITYDQYWNEISQPSMLSIPDIRTLKDKMEIIEDRINNHFTGARANRKALASKISKALAIRILCDDLDKKNGANALSLKEDICMTIPGVDDPEFLLDTVESTAKQLINATSGQYVDKDHEGNFYIRTEGGLNISQIVEAYAFEVLKKKPEDADQYFFDFLQFVLGIQQNTYRTGFKIWQHSLEWIEKRSFRLGYIFFGNPNERSTTEPIQQYYIFFSPVFGKVERNDEPDEVYFDLTGLSEDFKNSILLYGAAKAKEVSATTDQKKLYLSQIEEHRKRSIILFDKEFVDKTIVYYKNDAKPLKSFPLMGEGSTKEIIFTTVSAKILDKYFNEKYPDYPAFKDLLQPITKDNFDGRIKNALKRIVEPGKPNRDGEAILSGLGLWSGQSLSTEHSKYADRILQRLKDAGEGAVVNKIDIIYSHYPSQNLYYSVDYNLDFQLQFVVLTALAFKADIEIIWSHGKSLTAGNIDTVLTLSLEDYFTFSHIRQPQGIPYRHLKALFSCLELPDLTTELEKPDTINEILTRSKEKIDRVLKTITELSKGLKCRNLELLTPEKTREMKSGLEVLSKTLDTIHSYNTYGKLKSFKLTEEVLLNDFASFKFCQKVESLNKRAEEFEKLTGYLYTAESYISDEEPLKKEIVSALAQLGEVIICENNAELKQYEALLKSLKDRYSQYYLQNYAKYRLSAQDNLQKEIILTGNDKKLCDLLKDFDFLDKTEYQNLINEISSLKEADHSLSKESLLGEPYHNFNPRDYIGKPAPKIIQLKERLEIILEKWKDSIKSVLKDPGLLENFEILSQEAKELVEDLINSRVEITTNNAGKLRSIISELMSGIEKVELTMDEISKQFNKPLSPKEMIESFTNLVEDISKGKERNKVRIILKNATTH